MAEESIFTKIIKGDIPAYKIYEDDKTLAFLDIHPVQAGHTLVVPKAEVEFVWDLTDEDYQAVMATARKVARRLRESLGIPFVGLKIVGVDVPHAHVHIIPFHASQELHREADLTGEPDHTALQHMAAKLAFPSS